MTGPIFRDPERAMLFGVCAGLADAFGISVGAVRAGAVLAGFVFNGLAVAAYLLLAAALPRRPAGGGGGVAADTLTEMRARAERLEARLARLEADVASGDYALRQRIRGLR